MRRTIFFSMVCAVIPAASAQLVHPNVYATTEGASNNAYPFRYSAGAGRYQQSHDASQFPGPMLITEIAFRYRGDTTVTAGSADFKLTLAYCATAWNAVGSSFAANIGANPTVVFDGLWSYPGFSGDPATPNPFTNRLKLTTPFAYNPAAGDLLIDIEMRQASTTSSGSFARAASDTGSYRVYTNSGSTTSTTGSVGNIGLIVEFTEGSITTYGSGCAGSGGLTPELLMSGNPGLGQQVILSLDQGLGGAPSVTMIGGAETSVPIGGGCTLLVQPPVLQLFIPLGGAGAGNGSYTLPGIIPLSSPVGPVFFQAFVADPAAVNGFSTSNGLRVDIQ